MVNSLDPQFFVFTVGLWFVFMVIAIINAIIRNSLYKPVIGDLAAHQISSITFIVAILVVTYLGMSLTNIQLTDLESVYTGAIWLISTILFEFIAGHYVFGNPWKKLSADYNLLQGRIWSLVLLTILVAPYTINKLL